MENCQVKIKEVSASKPLLTCRNGLDVVKIEGRGDPQDEFSGKSAYWLNGDRHAGGTTLIWAFLRNVGICGRDAKRKSQMETP